MNDWQISPEWEMTYSKLRGRYELIKDLKEIKIGQNITSKVELNFTLGAKKHFLP